MDNTLTLTPSTVITSTRLKWLCNHYRQALCHGEKNYLPKIRIRYVEKQGKFGYADFGDFFFFANDLYVWRQEEEYANRHNKNVVNSIFDKQCTRQEYACCFLYAGADTNYIDSNEEHIFVGDVIEIEENHCKTQLALGYFPYDGKEEPNYCFILNNHSLTLADCVHRKNMRLTRIGTVYFQLDRNFDTENMTQKVQDFNGWHDTNEEHEEKVFMSRYTPNFYLEPWKYHGLEILGVEYDWR